MSTVNGIALYPIDFTIEGRSSTQPEYGLFKLIACTDDGKVVEALYKHSSSFDEHGSTHSTPEPDSAVLDPAEQTLERHDSPQIIRLSLPATNTNRILSTKFVKKDDLNDFVVDDDNDRDYLACEEESISRDHMGLPDDRRRWREWQRLLDHDLIRLKEFPPLPLKDLLDNGLIIFEGLLMQNDAPRLQLVSRLVGEHQILDVEQDSESARIWLEALKMRRDILIESTSFASVSTDETVQQVYENYYLLYVESLGTQITDRNRVNRERFIRQLIGDAFLGTLILRPDTKGSNESLPDTDSSPRPDNGILSSALETDHGAVSSKPLSLQSPAAAAEELIVTRLRDYCTFQDQVPPLSLSQQAGISNVLAHLPDSIDDDPAEYSYQSTNQRLKLAQEERAAQSLDPRERRKAMKEAARLQRRLDKTLKMTQEVAIQRTLLPSITTAGRGIVLPGREAQSSQGVAPASSQSQGGIFAVSMTQPERGAFGTRPTKAKGKERGAPRKAGF